MTRLLIDDCRLPGTGIIPEGVLVARTFREGIRLLKELKGMIDVLYLDHDLACFEGEQEFTGYDVMLFLEKYPDFCPKELILVTANPVGRDKMQAAWEAIQQRKNKEN